MQRRVSRRTGTGMTAFASSLFVAHGSIGFNLQASVRPHCAPERAPVQRYSAADVAQCFFNAAFHPFQAANEDVRRGGLALQACLDLRPRIPPSAVAVP